MGVASGLAAAVGLLVFFVLVPHITQQLHARHARDSNKQSLKVPISAVLSICFLLNLRVLSYSCGFFMTNCVFCG